MPPPSGGGTPGGGGSTPPGGGGSTPPDVPPPTDLPPQDQPFPDRPPTTPPQDTPTTPPKNPPAGSPYDDISDIGRGPTLPGGLGSSFFSPSSILSNIANLSNSTFSPPPSGSVAYAPTTDPTLVTNTKFDALSSQVTFAKPLQTPGDIIAGLGKNPQLTAEQRATLVLVEKLEVLERGARAGQSGGVLRNSFTESTVGVASSIQQSFSSIADFFEPIGKYFSSILNPSTAEEKVVLGGEEKKDEAKLTTETKDDLLSAGDPTQVPWEIEETSIARAPDPFTTGPSVADALRDAVHEPGSVAGDLANIADRPSGDGGGVVTPATPAPSAQQEPASQGPSVEPFGIDEGDKEESGGPLTSVGEAVKTVVAAIGNGIKAGLIRILSWFS